MKKIPLLLALVALALAACSSPPPVPKQPSGQIRPANTQQQALDDLLEIARAGQPRRFKAERGSDVAQTLKSWAKTAGLTLHYKSGASLRTTGIIDEQDIRAAVMSLAEQFPNEAAVLVRFEPSRVMLVSDLQTSDALTCPNVPAGAIVVGRYCLTGSPTWFLETQDKLLSEALMRWAKAAKLQLVWHSDLDWPITLAHRKGFTGDLLEALEQLKADLADSVELAYTISDATLFIRAKPFTPSGGVHTKDSSLLTPPLFVSPLSSFAKEQI